MFDAASSIFPKESAERGKKGYARESSGRRLRSRILYRDLIKCHRGLCMKAIESSAHAKSNDRIFKQLTLIKKVRISTQKLRNKNGKLMSEESKTENIRLLLAEKWKDSKKVLLH